MYNKTITLDPDRPDRPLDPLRAMRHSAGRLLFADLPADLTAAAFVVVATLVLGLLLVGSRAAARARQRTASVD